MGPRENVFFPSSKKQKRTGSIKWGNLINDPVTNSKTM